MDSEPWQCTHCNVEMDSSDQSFLTVDLRRKPRDRTREICKDCYYNIYQKRLRRNRRRFDQKHPLPAFEVLQG